MTDHCPNCAALRERVERCEKALTEICNGYGKYGYFYAFDLAQKALATPTPEPTTPPQQEQLSPVAGQADLDWLVQVIQKATLDAERQRVLGVLDARIAELNLYDNEDNEAAGGELYGYQWLQRHLRQPQQGGGESGG